MVRFKIREVPSYLRPCVSITLLVAVETTDKNNLRKGKSQSITANKAQQPEHEAAGHMASTFRKQRGICGDAPPTSFDSAWPLPCRMSAPPTLSL